MSQGATRDRFKIAVEDDLAILLAQTRSQLTQITEPILISAIPLSKLLLENLL